MIEPAPAGEFTVWPLHITIVPWFTVSEKTKLDEVLSKVAARHEAFLVSAGRKEVFGKKDKLAVNLINDSGELHRLHWEVFHSLEKNGFLVHQKTHLGEKYKPHVTHQGKKHLKENEELVIDRFSLVRQVRQKKTGRMIKKVVKDYVLSA